MLYGVLCLFCYVGVRLLSMVVWCVCERLCDIVCGLCWCLWFKMCLWVLRFIVCNCMVWLFCAFLLCLLCGELCDVVGLELVMCLSCVYVLVCVCFMGALFVIDCVMVYGLSCVCLRL